MFVFQRSCKRFDVRVCNRLESYPVLFVSLTSHDKDVTQNDNAATSLSLTLTMLIDLV
jgi:hypothetical protein